VDVGDYDFCCENEQSELGCIAEAGAFAISGLDKSMAKVINTYVTQLKLGESIYDYPPGGWEYHGKKD
jgi:hypothetical protein